MHEASIPIAAKIVIASAKTVDGRSVVTGANSRAVRLYKVGAV
jgi:hypothetical protein